MDDRWALAIETSGRSAPVALGRGVDDVVSREVERSRRHNLALLPTIDALCRERGVGASGLAAVFVSLGPGSFTGLRVAVAAAQMLGLSRGCDLVGVPTIEALAANVPPERRDEAVALCLNTKRGRAYAAVVHGGRFVRAAANVELEALWAGPPRPVAAVAEKLDAVPASVVWLNEGHAEVRAEVVYRLGRERWLAGETTPPARLLPIYGREPEAVRLWEARRGG